MGNNGKPRPLVAIIGERMKQFREDRGLRQSDIAAAAAECGLSWGRSSVAALEAGTRNLSIGELFMLPWVVFTAGGWDKPILPPEEHVTLSGSITSTPSGMATSLAMLLEPIGGKGSTAPLRVQRMLGEQYSHAESAPIQPPAVDDGLSSARLAAEDAAWRHICALTYPFIDYDEAGRQTAVEMELTTKIAARLELPDGQVATWHHVMVFSWGLWGRSAGAERDARAELGKHSTARSLQSARGHVTRDLIAELAAEAAAKWPVVQSVLDQMAPYWGDVEELYNWYQRQYRIARDTQAAARNLAAGSEFQKDLRAVSLLRQIGVELKDARLGNSLSIQDVVEISGLKEWQIVSLEESEYVATANFANTRRPLRVYSLSVGLDPRDILKRYDAATSDFLAKSRGIEASSGQGLSAGTASGGDEV
ncbi:hypothetical protein ABZ883_26280 [Streptomyces sp. NPDC046977]|uniref:hypothetical protein n=1 Tax=Streptomyces sp. NPDC046977 TaxID=3154703 RepID=UPI0033FF76AA